MEVQPLGVGHLVSEDALIHASVELVEAMRGVAPAPGREEASKRGAPDLREACTGNRAPPSNTPVHACGGWPEFREAGEVKTRRVDCPSCLALMREADPVRWDELEERGLVSLPATSVCSKEHTP